ncbi:MAG TPA: FAD-dependent oxidoreductase [Gemmataceae bacterium]|jgi:glycine/D-amino acid oxidase-like deaminating enzyme/nitrite reductase/ring-hydroxylating ferredoxin subunit|nr:FAD-dependent oxidoreductase [Gemmataceae bacterium]
MTTRSYWTVRPGLPRFTPLKRKLAVDVAVIGGGITGISTAYALQKAGLSVALFERDRFGRGDTGHTTAHVTCVTDQRLNKLVSSFGRDHAQAAWDAGRAAIQHIHDTVHAENIDCDFAWLPGYLHASPDESTEDGDLKEDANLAAALGFGAVYEPKIPLFGTHGVRFPDQARFNPLKYLAGLLRSFGPKAHAYEASEVTEVQEDPLRLTVNGHEVHCGYLVIATHVPLTGLKNVLRATVFQSKLAAYTSYAIGAPVPKGSFPEALFWDTADPYRYLRVEPRARDSFAIYGGEDHKTGQEDDPAGCFGRLEKGLAQLHSAAKVTHRWSGQVIETPDGLPYIGEVADKQFVATGFAGNGMTFGTVAAMMAADRFASRKNPWTNLFDPARTKVLTGVWDYLRENLDYPYYLIRDRLAGSEGTELSAVKKGEGKILRLKGERVAASRDNAGKVITVSPVCTHLGCLVRWNAAERTWDCPCHGSRFAASGEVIAGPAETALEKRTVDCE